MRTKPGFPLLIKTACRFQYSQSKHSFGDSAIETTMSDDLDKGFLMWEDCARRLASGEFRRIVVLTGAGISTAAGIPDYRGEGGVSAEQWKRTESEMAELLKSAEPTACHRMIRRLADLGWIRRVYTQNVDGLHEKSGVLPPTLLPIHGTLADGSCVAMGEKLPDEFWELAIKDFVLAVKCANLDCPPPDLLLVLGTSLKVAPACALPNMARKRVPRWWIALRPPISNDFGPGDCVQVGKVRISCRLTLRTRRRANDRVFDIGCEEFSHRVLSLLPGNSGRQ